MRRLLGVLAVVAGSVALAVALGIAAVVVPGPGQALARRLALAVARRAVDGRVTLGTLGGPLWRSVTATDVTLATPDGRPVIHVARLTARYRLADLLRGRIVLSHVTLDQPTVRLEAAADGRLTLEHLFRLGGPGARAGPRPVVELRDVRVSGGLVVLRTRDGAGRRTRERRFEDLDLDLTRLRASDPDSTAMVADIGRLAARVTDPAVRVGDARGRVRLDGDSLRFALAHLALPGTAGAAEGVVRWGDATEHGAPAVDVLATLGRARFADFAWAVSGLPAEGGGRLTVRVRLWPGGGGDFAIRDADLAAGRTRLRGSAAFTVDRPGGAVIEQLALDAEPLELRLLAPFLGPMPVAGEVRGQVAASGAPAALRVQTTLAFTDEGVPAHPVSRVTGSGVMALGGPAGVVFHHFALVRSDVALATITRLAPAVTLHGRLRLSGELDGPWKDAAFNGVLRHEDGDGASLLRGAVRLTLADTVAVHADVVADSLSLDDLAASYPVIPVRGRVAGHVRLAGPVTALAYAATLAGPGGGLRGRGEMAVGDSGVRIRGEGSLDSLDLAASLPGAPETRLTGTWRLDVTMPTADSTAPDTGSLALALGSGEVAHDVLQRAGATVALTPAGIVVDTAYLEQPGTVLGASGTLGRAGGAPGRLELLFRADTLANLAALAGWVDRAGGDSAAPLADLRGAGRVRGSVEGTTAAWTVRGDATVDSLGTGGLAVTGAHVAGTLQRVGGGFRVTLAAGADSLVVAGLRYGGVAMRADGSPDSLRVEATAGFALGSSAEAAVALRSDSAGWSARVLDARLGLLGRTWTVAGHPVVTATAASVAFDTLELRGSDGGRVRLSGRIPRAGEGDFSFAADSVPLRDLYALAQRDTTGIGGAASATLRLEGPASQPRMAATASVVGARFGEFGAPLLVGAADYADRRLRFQARLGKPGEAVVTASGTVPLDLALAPTGPRQIPGPLDIRARADSVDLAIVDVLTTLLRGVSGRLTADVAVQGTWERPELTGSARITDGAASVPVLGAHYTDIAMQLGLRGDSLVVESARLKGGAGTLEIGGGVQFPTLARPVLNLSLRARSFAAFSQRDFAGLTGSGTLTLTGPLLGATLSGQWTVDAGFLAFADLVEKRLVNLDDPEFRAVVDSNLAQAADLGPTAQNVFLDSLRIRGLTVTMGPDVWLRSHEANIQLAGSFTVAKEVEAGASRYRLDGTLRAVRGTYRLVVGPTAKEFRVTRGTVRFYGTPDLNPVLDIAAEHTVRAVNGGDLVVRAVIGGTLLVPRLSLESDERPPLSESEIVSYLLFGRPSFDLASGSGAGPATTSEQAILEGAMAGLAGVVSGELEQTLVTSLGIPVDYLAIRPGAGSVGDIFSSARVEAGTQIGERTFLTVNAGLCQVARGSQILGASVEHRLGSAWTVEASIEPTVQDCRPGGFQIRPPVPYQVGFDLFWQWGTP